MNALETILGLQWKSSWRMVLPSPDVGNEPVSVVTTARRAGLPLLSLVLVIWCGIFVKHHCQDLETWFFFLGAHVIAAPSFSVILSSLQWPFYDRIYNFPQHPWKKSIWVWTHLAPLCPAASHPLDFNSLLIMVVVPFPVLRLPVW